jgi:TPR repeat protein
MVQPYRPGVNPPQYPSIRPRDSGPSIFRSDAFKGLYYVDKDVKAAMDKKDYAFLLSYYGKKCQPKDNDGFKATEDFASGGRGVGNCYFLGELYLKGQGVDKDVGKAIGYYETAANGGFWPAVADLADLYLKGKDVPRDDAKGTGYLSAYITNPKNSKVGTCFGASLLGEVYVKGKLVPKNGSEAEKWYQYCLDKADHPNDPTPEDFIVHDLLLLADLYADEGLMPGKLDAAVKLYSRIVKVAGDSHYREDAQPAQRALGQMYIAGRGVPKDAAKGIDLSPTRNRRSFSITSIPPAKSSRQIQPRRPPISISPSRPSGRRRRPSPPATRSGPIRRNRTRPRRCCLRRSSPATRRRNMNWAIISSNSALRAPGR